jgi:hypothetical protein
MRRILAAGIVTVIAAVLAPAAGARAPQVLRVGTFKGIPGQFASVQAAVDAARPGDWILVGPGDYKTTSIRRPAGRPDLPSGILITKAGLYLRGMNRNTVIIDGTKPGSPKCSGKAANQNFGPVSRKGRLGLNGILVWKANNVWIQNLTACNFHLGSGSGNTGNEIWWDGGDGSGKIGGFGYYGSYLNATDTFFGRNGTAGRYGIFSSNWSGGSWYQTYASNFSDSAYYIGACSQLCNQTINAAHGQFSSLGYSGSNSGGQVVIKNSEFDQNLDGFDTNSQNGDNPPPQNGTCPHNGISPITHTHSCWVFMNNYVHDNNNPNVPGIGAAGNAPVGTGMSISGGRNDTVMHNRFVRNNAWAVLEAMYPDSTSQPCTGGKPNFSILGFNVACLYDQFGNAILNNSFTNNGGFGHVTNGDIATMNLTGGNPTNCYSGNTDPAGVTTSPSGLEQSHPSCDSSSAPANVNPPLFTELLCGNAGALIGVHIACPGGHPYPTRTHVDLRPLPAGLPTMPNPCAGVPANPWCPRRG